jgi:putative toxin-antitoxin system antitoxin component (TIGR02293 family)
MMRQVAATVGPVSTREPLAVAVFHKLGGRSILGSEVLSSGDLARVVSERIPLRVLAHVQRSRIFSCSEIQRLIIPARTRRHRQERKERLTVEESDRLVRLARIQALAEDVFGDSVRANRWLREPLGELNGKPPLELARTEAGARLIEQILAKVDWGAAA